MRPHVATDHVNRFKECLKFLSDNFESIPEAVQPKFMKILIKEQSNQMIGGDQQSWCFAIMRYVAIKRGRRI